MRRLSLRRRTWLLGGVVVVALAAAAVAGAAVLTAGTPVRVPDNPLAANAACAPLVAQQTALGSVNYADSEVEPYVAADPTNPQHLVGSVQQDRWNDGGSNGLTNVVSTNGGATWQLASSQPQFTRCEGAAPGSPGDLNRATDPWVSFSSDGQDRVLDQRLVQRERSGVRRGELDHHQPLDRRRRDLADAGHGALRRLDHRAERQGDRDGRPVQRR